MTPVVWELAHSVETDASPAFAWSYWIHVENWVDPPAEFELDGPFVAGARGTTRIPGQEPLHWFIRDVNPPKTATIQMELEQATLSFEWRFDGLADGRTLLTRRIVLTGVNAKTYLSQVKTAFTADLAEGMNRLAWAMANADLIRKRATPD
jgi:hypothetical protein